jgi:SAM-dependent methyltransferase
VMIASAQSSLAPLLNIGCGSHFDPRWTNIDLVSTSPHVTAHDITRGLPYQNETFQVVYHSHILEHLAQPDALAMLRECHRVLQPGGIVRVVVPDLEFCARLYLQTFERVEEAQDEIAREHYEWAVLNLIDQMVRGKSGGLMVEFLSRPEMKDLPFIIENGGGMVIKELRELINRPKSNTNELARLRSILRPQNYPNLLRKAVARLVFGKEASKFFFYRTGEVHRWMYDKYSLATLLRKAQFNNITFVSPGESAIPDWDMYHLDIDASNNIHKPGSLFAEAVR